MHRLDTLKLLAKSNFLLKELQLLLKQPFPFYVAWSECKAFNGAVLTDRQSTLQLLFFQPDSRSEDSGALVVSLADMKISGFMRSDSELHLTQTQFAKAVILAEQKYDQLTANSGPEVFHQISRLHFRVRITEAVKDRELKCDQFLKSISALFPGMAIPEPVFEEDWLSPDLDPDISTDLSSLYERELEIALDSPLQEADCCSLIRSKFPYIGDDLFGSGQTIHSHASKPLQQWGISSLHLYARHF